MNNKLIQAGLLLFIVTIVSKIVALFVTIFFSFYFGADVITDAYYAAGTIPNLINNSLTLCTLSLFIPVYIKCRNETSNEKADEFASNVFNSYVILNCILFLAICLSSPILARIVAPGFSEEGQNHTKNMICLLSTSFPFTVAVYTLSNLSNANQRYIIPSVLTILNQTLVIIFSVVIAPKYGIYSYPFICTGAWVIQMAIFYFWSRDKLFRHRLIVNLHDKYFMYMMKQSVPVMITTAADQVNLAADNIICSDLLDGSLSCLGYAQRLLSSINGIVASTLLAIYYPIISKQYEEKDKNGLDSSLRRYLEVMLLLTLPVTFLLIGNANTLINLVFNRGAMKADSIYKITILFVFYVMGLVFVSLKEFFTRLFYIIGDTKRPTIINSACIAMNIILSLVFKVLWGVYGIAIATTLSTAICAIIEGGVLIKRAGGIEAINRHDIINKQNIAQIVLACTLAMVAMVFVQSKLKSDSAMVKIIISGLVYFTIMAGVLLIVKNEYLVHCLEKVTKSR